MDREKNGLNDEERTLLELFKKRFPEHKPTSAEERLLAEVEIGEVIDYRSEDAADNDPGKAEQWGDERSISARVMEWLCTDRVAKVRVTHKGIQVSGAKITGLLDLAFVDVPFQLGFDGCAFTGEIDLSNSHVKTVSFEGSHTQCVMADGLKSDGDVFLRDGFKAEGEVSLAGAMIGGNLECDEGQFIHPDGNALSAYRMDVKGDVFLRNGFKAEGEVSLAGATIGGQLDCSNGQFIHPDGNALNADGMDVKGTLFLSDGFKAEGEVRLPGATIGGGLNCSDGQFIHPDGNALNADGVDVKGGVFLSDGFKVEGEVSLAGATIGGQLYCSNGYFIHPDGSALSAYRMDVKGDVFLRNGFKAEGEVSLVGATIGGNLECDEGQFIHPDGYSLSAYGMDVKGDVFLRNDFKAEGEVSLVGATIGGQLDCSNGQFIHPDGNALNADGMDVKGGVFLRNSFKAEGVVRLPGATIGGGLDCSDGQFVHPDGNALNADGTDVKGNVFLSDGFKAEGVVRLPGATIGGDLNCSDGQFIHPDGYSLGADGMDVKGTLFLSDGFKAEGEVSLVGATIGGNLECDEGQFIRPDGYSLSADGMDVKGNVFLRNDFKAEGTVSFVGATIGRWLCLTGVLEPEKVRFDLSSATVDTLWDEKASWPAKANLTLDGFVYKKLAEDAPHDAKARIKWLRLQSTEQFHPQPYEQLAKVFRESGYEDEAKRIHIAKNVDRRKRGNMPLLFRPLHSLLGLLTGYGYRPWRPIFVALVLIGIGWGLFYAGGREGIVMRVISERFASSSEQNGDLVQPNFHPLLYSFDVFLPVITFEHTEHWAPNENETGRLICKIPINGLALCGYKWFLNVAGWVLTTLFITTLTGTLRRRL